MNNSKHDVGSLVRARGRDWVVQPESYQIEDLLFLLTLMDVLQVLSIVLT